ncbi:hypothetical protein GCM10009665_60150 [Kitasatospora nipponensis]|uniref:Chromosome partitioning protein n=1 Tax=Kitasatospora nipponensis TaxID=258049 RepID=A0ABN1WVE4_9ACTN
MVIEAGVVAGYVIAWAVRKARRAAGVLDGEVDTVIDVGLDRLHTAVTARLGTHPVLEDLAEEAATDGGQVSELTRQQLELAVTAAARKDEHFARTVTDLLAQVQADEKATGASVVAGAGARVFTGDAHVQASGSGTAIGQVGGDVHLSQSGDGGGDQGRGPS